MSRTELALALRAPLEDAHLHRKDGGAVGIAVAPVDGGKRRLNFKEDDEGDWVKSETLRQPCEGGRRQAVKKGQFNAASKQ